MKKILLGVFVLSVICLIPGSLFARSGDKVTAYYFHTTFRCPSCHKIEQYTEEAIKKYFAKEIETGDLEHRIINIEEKGNEHFVQDYKLYTKSVVLSLIQDGKEARFKNLEQVWQLLRNKDKFYQYIKNETQAFLDSLREDDRS